MKILVLNKKEEQIGSSFILQEDSSFETGQTIFHGGVQYKIKKIRVESHYVFLIVKKLESEV